MQKIHHAHVFFFCFFFSDFSPELKFERQMEIESPFRSLWSLKWILEKVRLIYLSVCLQDQLSLRMFIISGSSSVHICTHLSVSPHLSFVCLTLFLSGCLSVTWRGTFTHQKDFVQAWISLGVAFKILSWRSS